MSKWRAMLELDRRGLKISEISSNDFYYVLNKRLMNDTFYSRQLGIQYYNMTKLKRLGRPFVTLAIHLGGYQLEKNNSTSSEPSQPI
jgi:hypothetical protein